MKTSTLAKAYHKISAQRARRKLEETRIQCAWVRAPAITNRRTRMHRHTVARDATDGRDSGKSRFFRLKTKLVTCEQVEYIVIIDLLLRCFASRILPDYYCVHILCVECVACAGRNICPWCAATVSERRVSARSDSEIKVTHISSIFVWRRFLDICIIVRLSAHVALSRRRQCASWAVRNILLIERQ